MENTTKLILSQDDYEKLSSLLRLANEETADLLGDELSQASVVPNQNLPPDVVAMNSKVKFEDLDTGKTSEVQLVYPHQAKIEENKISIFSPVGSALIGLRIGQSIEWPMPNGKEKKLKVVAVSNECL